MKKIIINVILAVFLIPIPAMSDDSCEQQCPEGKVLASFADGNKVSCECVDASEGMVEGPAGCEGEGCDAPNETAEQNS
ncbi:MAG: hypothetical protein GYA55_12920 [SAR324 cluster bacterium]|uniref:Uncharacterized protein n=1 Tax=SAR324 cluster bacterium TaxID=2024889 RepID=A0A7X9FTK1_9DELT|nr:hypothetical protein [SAR324 cluster bacterium]